MKTLKQTLLASAGVIVVTGSVYAADLPLKAAGPMMVPVSNWTGPYIGAHVGAAGYQNTCAPGGGVNSGYACAQSDPDTGRDIGFVGGVQAGYDWQDRYFVYGVAADWSWTNLKTTTWGNSGSVSHTSKVSWLASFRGRAGLAVDTTLVYVTGGAALGRFKHEGLVGVGKSANFAFSDTLVGWVAGVGVEHRFNRNWSVALEYLHYDFGTDSKHVTTASTGSTYNLDFTHVVDTVRVGLNYRF